ncbi:hypothetical protein FisN_9Hu331 [Fistulifera solaris]|jgi:hypothetical protein|uniref:Trafficking protein particle complex subunit n=1 Tax=Fistulifera solaris TaxID=1519565 RepID=A0A1Z5KCQ0_FISSO|nr:hypothetical protein FisN_9Hu331 [Fistulifera solaris]|eukprot:GAX24080.1 hypothetical protein FisN_9Hu331 [Fistulifera solaris]
MGIHSIHVFDRKGKTLFTKRYAEEDAPDEEFAAEQRKLVFGMLFSLKEIASSLSPAKEDSIHSVQIGASTLYTLETASGLRFALYLDRVGEDESNVQKKASTIRSALQHIYNNLWINQVTRSPLYDPVHPNVNETGFEQHLDTYLSSFSSQSWYK